MVAAVVDADDEPVAGRLVTPAGTRSVAPFTYKVPVLPDNVTARCVHWFSGSGPGASSRCSLPFPVVVIAYRGLLVHTGDLMGCPPPQADQRRHPAAEKARMSQPRTWNT